MLPVIMSFYTLIFGVLYLLIPVMVTDISSPLLMITVDSCGLFYSKPKQKFLIMFNHSLKWSKLNFMSPLSVLDLIMVLNSSFLHFMNLMVFYTKNLVLKLPNKMEGLRKHQHILNAGIALLCQFKPPASYWSYAILHAVFLTNRIPTPLLQGQSPYKILHQKLPDINTFKVFGCLCHASSLQSHRTKLQTRAIKKNFLGYKSGYKGYILLDIQSREIFVSRHVVFHEHFLPYPSNLEFIIAN